MSQSIPQINSHRKNKLDWIKITALTTVTKCKTHRYYFRLAREESYLGICRNFGASLEVNWSPRRKTKALISCLLKLGFRPSSEKNWPTNFTLKYLEHTAENMMHSQFCTCVFSLRAKSKQLKLHVKYCARLRVRRRSIDSLKWCHEMYWTQTLLTSSATRSRFKLLAIFAALKIHKKSCF